MPFVVKPEPSTPRPILPEIDPFEPVLPVTVVPPVPKPKEPELPPVPAPPVKPKETPVQEYNGLFFSPDIGKFIDSDTKKPISDFTFHTANIMGVPANPLNYPTTDTVDWILEVLKGLPDFWFARKIEAKWAFYSSDFPQWLVEATKRDGRNLVFAPGLFAAILIKHGERIALTNLNDEFPKG